ncbi:MULTISPECIES: SCO family protein [unclassified Moritella]|uniref:SCO family protein n=1 Tax=unclassified Moritella TaxID=2637987 RepID=UPI001BA6AE93|nr:MULTISPECIES: SCO family protein [unclassified Moritella]QUM86848.1 SCO family protein [Moritella sp. 28]QUM91073.1 SCO family protein [Moritella sp. 36]
MKKSKAIIAAGIIGLSALGAIIANNIQQSNLPTFTTAYAQPKQISLPDFELGDNKEYTKALFKGKWSLVFFGYASCPDICPTELYNLNNVANIMTDAGKTMPQVVFISVDPKRDSNEMLTTYTHFYNDNFIGITGETSEIDKLVASFGVIYQKTFLANNGKYVSVPYNSPIPEGQRESYLINHSSRLYLVNPEGQYVAAFAPPHSAKKIAKDLLKL